ncbi:MAG: AAA family ATPase [Chloroflexi bacterium]|nr:AAA family ATPase [Chloroflexota bacterium]
MPTASESKRPTADELHLLQLVFDRFHATGVWPHVSELQLELDRAKDRLDVVAVGEDLDPGLGAVQWGPHGEVSLTLHGIALCAGEAEELSDTLAVVQFAYQLYLEAGIGAEIRSEELAARFGMSDLRLRRVHLIIQRLPGLGGGGGIEGGPWRRQVDLGIRRFADVTKVDDLLRHSPRIRRPSVSGQGTRNGVTNARTSRRTSARQHRPRKGSSSPSDGGRSSLPQSQLDSGETSSQRKPTLLQIQARNFRSLDEVVVDLGQLTVLVGPNGSGKSNFVDCLSFVTDSVTSTLARAVQVRGGIDGVRRRSAGHPTNMGIRLDLRLTGRRIASYAFEIAARSQGDFVVKRETCRIATEGVISAAYDLREGEFKEAPSGVRPRIAPDRLALTVLSATEEFRDVYDFIAGMRFYSLVPDHIRALQDPDTGLSLKKDGSNAASVLREVKARNTEDYERLCRLLGKVVPGTTSVEYERVGSKETLQFRQQIGTQYPWTFPPLNMSDGTLRVFGLLLAIYQQPPPPFVAVEEPESTVHPGALDVLLDAFLEGQQRSQVLITTHSPDLLDSPKIADEQIRVVTATAGRTSISPVSAASRAAVRRGLYSAGELLRANSLDPDLAASVHLNAELDLFGRPAHD